MKFLENIFGSKAEGPVELPPDQPARSVAMIRAELELARDSVEPLAAKLATAQAELASAQQRYDDGVRDYALGRLSSEPDRGELAAAVSKCDALRRIAGEQQRVIARLTIEFSRAQLTEAVADGRDRLPVLIHVAESINAEFEAAMLNVRKLEHELFAAMFSERSGLKQPFLSAELTREAAKARYSIRVRVEDVARQSGYYPALHADWETDGLPNLGRENPNWYRDNSLPLAAAKEQDRLSGRDVMASRLAEARKWS